MNLLLLKGFNNYFNRKIKKYSTLADYKIRSSKFYSFTNINFNPNDGVATAQVIGSENQKDGSSILDWETSGSPDYLVCYETNEGTNTIIHRWFVLECVRTRAGQYQLALKRDLVADHLESILTSPCFVEKGFVQHNNQALIFADENVGFNQIKSSEQPLYDNTGCPWIVMYLAKNKPSARQKVISKTTLDTDGYKIPNDYPWYGILGTAHDPTKIYRLRGASQFVFKPIVAGVISKDHSFNYARRVVLPWNYSGVDGRWHLASSKRVEKLPGTYNGGAYTMCRGDIGLTPASNLIHSNDDGRIVPTIITGSNYYYSTSLDARVAKDATDIMNYADLLNQTQDDSVQGWMSDAATAFKAYLGRLNDPDYQPGKTSYKYIGGNQLFMSDGEIMSYANTLMYYGSKWYKVRINKSEYVATKIQYFGLDGNNDIETKASTLYSAMGSTNNMKDYMISTAIDAFTHRNPDNEMVEVDLASWYYDIVFEEVTNDLTRTDIATPDIRLQLQDAAYDMIAIPYGAIKVHIPDEDATQPDIEFTTQATAGLAMARSIAATLTDSVVYDVQMMPYCPVREVVPRNPTPEILNYINLGKNTNRNSWWSGIYKVETEEETPVRSNAVSIILYCKNSSGTFNISKRIRWIPEDWSKVPITGVLPAQDDVSEYDKSKWVKRVVNCRKYRLVAPNYQSVFEYEPLKNRKPDQIYSAGEGEITFNVDYTYKPFNPYVHIAPLFEEKGLYGKDTNDNRGLIFQGDFSVGYYSDRWAEYQVQNANYANIFNRELQHLDVQQGIEWEKFKVEATVDLIKESLGLGGGLQGAQAGASSGTWQGAVIGAAVGTTTGIAGSLVGSHYDQKWLREAQRENRSYMKDMYELQLGNVKALPYSLAKSDALTANFKYVPFVEIFECLETEENIFYDKLKYDGMTVDAIGYLGNYIPQDGKYDFQRLKGRMIMMDNITDDFHIADAIYQEVFNGFYFVNPNDGVETTEDDSSDEGE